MLITKGRGMLSEGTLHFVGVTDRHGDCRSSLTGREREEERGEEGRVQCPGGRGGVLEVYRNLGVGVKLQKSALRDV